MVAPLIVLAVIFIHYNGPYNVSNDKVIWKSYNDIYLNNNAESCAEADEGCSQMIRVQPAYGHNFIKNGSFEETDFDFNFWNSCSSSACLVNDSYSDDLALEVNNESLFCRSRATNIQYFWENIYFLILC